MEKSELYRNFINNIEDERARLGYSQKRMAEALDMSLSSYKSLLRGDDVNISMYSMYLAYKLTGKIASELTQESMDEIDLLVAFRSLPAHKRLAIVTMLNLERELAEADEEYEDPKNKAYPVSCYIPTGNMEDGMLFDSSAFETIDVSKYVRLCPNGIDCAIKITSNHLHPVYHLDDVLLINKSAPRDGDTGIFINKKTHRAYIRKFRQTDPCQLVPLNGNGQIIYVNSHDVADMNQWIKFGHVIMRVKI